MKKPHRLTKRARLLQSLEWWTKERAEAITNGDEIGREIAERNRANTLRELLKLRTR